MNNITVDRKTQLRFKSKRKSLTDSLFLAQLLNVYERMNTPKAETKIVKEPKVKEVIEQPTKRSYKKREA